MPTDESDAVAPPATEPRVKTRARLIAVAAISVLVVVALYVLLATPTGATLRRDPHLLTEQVRHLNSQYPLLSVGGYLAAYFLFSLSMLPVWWLQILAGAAVGLYEGTALSLIAATVAAMTAASLSRFVGGDWMHRRVESRLARLAAINDSLGHNGLLVVFAVRLIHLLPFGLCNYALGLTRISMRDIVIGTFLGSVPAVALYVGTGAGYHPWRNRPFLIIVGGLNILLLVPVGLRYWSPKWFAKWGVE